MVADKKCAAIYESVGGRISIAEFERTTKSIYAVSPEQIFAVSQLFARDGFIKVADLFTELNVVRENPTTRAP